MKCTTRRMAMAAAVLGLMVGPTRADVTITIQQVGPNVVATGSGSIDLTGLTLLAHDSGGSASLWPGEPVAVMGPTSLPNRSQYMGATGPSSFGSGGLTPASSGSGDTFGVEGSGGSAGLLIDVPQNYVSNTALSATDYYDNQTLASLGLTPGTYVYTWGPTTAPDGSLTVQIISPAAVVPEPSTSIVAVFGGAAFLAYGWSRRRRELRRQAAA